jgi:toxin ParE1/3/4
MKKRRVVKHERALRDLVLRCESIRQRNPRAALRFLDAAETTIRKLAASPGIGARYDADHPVLAELRLFPIARFKKDLIFYRLIPDGIEIVRVLHGARDIASILADQFGVEREAAVDDQNSDESEE